MHKRIFLLTIFFLTSINLQAQHFNPEFSKLCIREANPDHEFGEIKMVKSLHDGKIIVSYCVARNDLFYSVLSESCEVLSTFDISEILDDRLYFYVDRASLYFSKYGDIVEIEIYTGKVKSSQRAKHLFVPDSDDIDKSLNDKRFWLSGGVYRMVGVNYYADDNSFRFSVFPHKENENIVGVAGVINGNETFVLSEDSKGGYSLSSYNPKKGRKTGKSFFSFRTEIPRQWPRENLTLSPDKKWLVVCLSDDYTQADVPQCVQLVFCNMENGDVFDSIVDINHGGFFDKIDWDFDSKYFIVYDNGAANIYKVFLPN